MGDLHRRTGTLHVDHAALFPGLPAGERQAFRAEGLAQLRDSIWSDAMELLELCFAYSG